MRKSLECFYINKTLSSPMVIISYYYIKNDQFHSCKDNNNKVLLDFVVSYFIIINALIYLGSRSLIYYVIYMRHLTLIFLFKKIKVTITWICRYKIYFTSDKFIIKRYVFTYNGIIISWRFDKWTIMTVINSLRNIRNI